MIPFFIAYGLGLYLVAGAIGDAFSGQAPHPRSELVIQRSGKAPGEPSVNASDTAKAVRAVESNAVVHDLAQGGKISVTRSGPWTASEERSDAGPEPRTGVGVVLKVDLPEPIDVDLSTTPDLAGAPADGVPSRETAGASVVRNVSSLAVLYDPVTDEIVSILPVPDAAPPIPADLGPPPGIPASSDGRSDTRTAVRPNE